MVYKSVKGRQKGKEIIVRLTDPQGEKLYEMVGSNNIPDFLEINGERLRADTIIAIARETTWWATDEQAQVSRGRHRCRMCLIVYPNASHCACARPLPSNAAIIHESHHLTPNELTEGWRRAIRIALTYPGVTMDSPLVKRVMERYKFQKGELFTP